MNKNNVGVWIPPEIMNIKELSFIEKGVYVEIINLCKLGKCYASNKHFSDMFICGERSVTRYVYKLENLGYIKTIQHSLKDREITVAKMATDNKNMIAKKSNMIDNLSSDDSQNGDINIQEININKQGIKSLKEFFEKEGKNITKIIK